MSAPGRYRHITGAADDGVVRADACVLHGVTVNKAAAGQTVTLHDCATEGAVSAANAVAVVALDGATSVVFACGVWLTAGLVAIVSGGAPDLTVIWE